MNQTWKPLLLGLSLLSAACSSDNGQANDAGHAGHADHIGHNTAATPTDSAAQPHATTQAVAEVVPAFANAPATLQTQLASATQQYLALQKALAADDSATAKGKAMSLVAALGKMSANALPNDQQAFLQDRIKTMQASAGQLAAASNLAGQRSAFALLSEDLATVLKTYGQAGDPVYLTYCPMAFNNKGADWIAASEQVQNPYYGSKMPNCGEVREKLTTR